MREVAWFLLVRTELLPAGVRGPVMFRVVKRWRLEGATHIGWMCLGLDTGGALAVLAVGARGADDEHGATSAASGLIGRHGGRGEIVMLLFEKCVVVLVLLVSERAVAALLGRKGLEPGHPRNRRLSKLPGWP